MAEATGTGDGSADGPRDAHRLSPTGYALLGLLLFTGRPEAPMTAYELKQRADRTLRYYWVAPAMSQVYTEVDRLVRAGLVEARAGEDEPADGRSGRRTTRYAITDAGERRLRGWLADEPAGFPVLKHPVALRLLMGNLSSPEDVAGLLDDYRAALVDRRRDLQAVRDMLGDRPEVAYPAMVADWGLAYYDSEDRIVAELRDRLPGGTPGAAPGAVSAPAQPPDTTEPPRG